MFDSILRTKFKEFAKSIFLSELKQTGVEAALANQLSCCGASVGANIHETRYAHSIIELTVASKKRQGAVSLTQQRFQ